MNCGMCLFFSKSDAHPYGICTLSRALVTRSTSACNKFEDEKQSINKFMNKSW